MPDYRLIPDSIQDQFGKLRTKVQIFGGGYGNGKTAAACVQKVLRIAKEYPGANILVARSTYPKLNDTIRKEFLKWCPASWIVSFPLSKNADNTCTMKNGTTINFRYIQQQGKAAGEADGGQTTSNLLSATYDLIVVDQLEDPEITSKDFQDLLGRLRGNARYVGNDPTMPLTGPRWLVACVNPTRNWVYRELIAPLKLYERTGEIGADLLCLRQPAELSDGTPNPVADEPILDGDGRAQMLLSLVEGSTYTNAHNLGADFIQTLESSYKGQSRDRFLYGKWAAYEGLVHPDFDELTHCIPRSEMRLHLDMLYGRGILAKFLEGYDFGMTQPCCYLLGFTDRFKNVFIIDGFYKSEMEFSLEEQKKRIYELRNEYGADEDNHVWADPAIYRRTQVTKSQNVKTIAQLLNAGDFGVRTKPADNEIARGLLKVNTYLGISDYHRHPTRQTLGAPHLFVASELTYLISEFNSYYWKVGTDGKRIDIPVDKNDHGMNVLKYMLAKEPDLAVRVPKPKDQTHLHQWGERPSVEERSRRHG